MKRAKIAAAIEYEGWKQFAALERGHRHQNALFVGTGLEVWGAEIQAREAQNRGQQEHDTERNGAAHDVRAS